MAPKKLHVVGNSTPPSSPEPPPQLGEHGRALWRAVTAEYAIDDVGGQQLLLQAAFAADRAESLRQQIDADGEIIAVKGGGRKEHPGLRHELAARSFITRTIVRLGLNFEAIRPVGRPPGPVIA